MKSKRWRNSEVGNAGRLQLPTAAAWGSSLMNWRRIGLVAMLGLAWLFTAPRAMAADTNSPAPAASKVDDMNSQEILRAYLQLQEQLHATQLAIEQNRRESREAVAQNEETMANRLRGIEQALAMQRARELDAMQSSNRVMLIVAGSFAAVGFIAMLIMAYFQWRTVHGLAEISSILPASRALGAGTLAALGPGEALAGGGAAEQANGRLLGALGLLEKRLYDLEHAAVPQPAAGPRGVSNGNGNGNGHSEPVESDRAQLTSGPNNLAGLLTKGERLLDQNDAKSALACFEEALNLDPNHAEALVKLGTALERLQRLDEAIACYDRAIALDASMTVAYLHKGGLCNRLERFNDALECYEKALRTQEKRQG